VLHPQLVSRSFMRRLIPHTAPPIRFSVRSARVFASGVAVPFGHCHAYAWSVALRADLSVPLAGIQLPSATLRRCLPGVGLAL